jgi:hypothetical protein
MNTVFLSFYLKLKIYIYIYIYVSPHYSIKKLII